MSIRSPLQFFLGLIAALLLFVAPEAGTQRAVAQTRSVCDSMNITAQSAGECCFTFSMTRLNGRNITRIVLRPYGATITGATAGNTGGTSGASYTADSSQVRYNFPNGMPLRFDSAKVCFNSPQGVITLLVTWWAGDALLCTDTLTLRCQTTPPPQGQARASPSRCIGSTLRPSARRWRRPASCWTRKAPCSRIRTIRTRSRCSIPRSRARPIASPIGS